MLTVQPAHFDCCRRHWPSPVWSAWDRVWPPRRSTASRRRARRARRLRLSSTGRPERSPGDVLVAVVDTICHLATVDHAARRLSVYSMRRVARPRPARGQRLCAVALLPHKPGATEPPSYTWWFGRKTGAAGAVLAYGGVSTSAPIADHAGRLQSNVTSIVAPAFTTPTGAPPCSASWGHSQSYAQDHSARRHDRAARHQLEQLQPDPARKVPTLPWTGSAPPASVRRPSPPQRGARSVSSSR